MLAAALDLGASAPQLQICNSGSVWASPPTGAVIIMRTGGQRHPPLQDAKKSRTWADGVCPCKCQKEPGRGDTASRFFCRQNGRRRLCRACAGRRMERLIARNPSPPLRHSAAFTPSGTGHAICVRIFPGFVAAKSLSAAVGAAFSRRTSRSVAVCGYGNRTRPKEDAPQVVYPARARSHASFFTNSEKFHRI